MVYYNKFNFFNLAFSSFFNIKLDPFPSLGMHEVGNLLLGVL
jgi:hypothetical protein